MVRPLALGVPELPGAARRRHQARALPRRHFDHAAVPGSVRRLRAQSTAAYRTVVSYAGENPFIDCAQRHAAARRGASGERRAGRRGAGESASSEHASTSIGVPTARATAAFAFSHPNDAWSTTTR